MSERVNRKYRKFAPESYQSRVMPNAERRKLGLPQDEILADYIPEKEERDEERETN